ncbi:hypothetical protein L2E82_26657 [Cichorium intybus]|uniref:Uncharacterized protein n=1 Tax=Cichorium intybus TaxID=13427 RepID=A0ACB9CR03_CICIN|nr:hypothetical protein L2E82_26657 [Cichorium intybus]
MHILQGLSILKPGKMVSMFFYNRVVERGIGENDWGREGWPVVAPMVIFLEEDVGGAGSIVLARTKTITGSYRKYLPEARDLLEIGIVVVVVVGLSTSSKFAEADQIG